MSSTPPARALSPDPLSHPRMPSEERRRQLIEAAIDAFSEKGFAGTTTKEIAAGAGVTEAIIFRHFATKQDLYSAILDYIQSESKSKRWLEGAQRLMAADDDEGLFRFVVQSIIDVNRTQPRFERLMMLAALEGNELATLHHQRVAMPIGHMVVEYIARRQEQGALRQCDPAAILLAVAGVAAFYASHKYILKICPEGLPDEQAVETFVGILMDGVRGPNAGLAKKKRTAR